MKKICKMAKIHGLVYILIGAFVSIMSWKLNKEKLLFFFYAGWAFVAVGVVKIIFNLVSGKAEKPKTHVQQSQPHHVTQNKPSPTRPQHPQAFHQQIKYCHRCRTPLRLHHKFCSNCGARV